MKPKAFFKCIFLDRSAMLSNPLVSFIRSFIQLFSSLSFRLVFTLKIFIIANYNVDFFSFSFSRSLFSAFAPFSQFRL